MTTTTDQSTAPAATSPAASRPGASVLRTLGVALAVVLVGYGAFQAVDFLSAGEGEEQLSFAAAPVVELVADGAVTVRAGEAGTVEVRRSWREGIAPVAFSARESSERLTVTHDCSWFTNACRAELEVTLPAETRVEIRSGSGRIEVTQVAELVARTGSGSITIDGVTGAVIARTGSGSVLARNLGADAELHTSSGSVEAEGVAGSLDASTGSGHVTVLEVGGEVLARSSSGRVEVREVGGKATVSTGSGDVLVAGVASHVDAHTSSGRATVHGNGAPVALDMSTSSGNQTIEAPTDPAAPITVKIRSGSGNVAYLAPLD